LRKENGKRKYGWLNSKMTFVPGSIQYIASSMKMMLDAGCRHIAGNCAYEPMYTDEDGKALYRQLKEVSQYVIKNGWDVAIAMLDEQIGDTTVGLQTAIAQTLKKNIRSKRS